MYRTRRKVQYRVRTFQAVIPGSLKKNYDHFLHLKLAKEYIHRFYFIDWYSIGRESLANRIYVDIWLTNYQSQQYRLGISPKPKTLWRTLWPGSGWAAGWFSAGHHSRPYSSYWGTGWAAAICWCCQVVTTDWLEKWRITLHFEFDHGNKLSSIFLIWPGIHVY